jgi:amino acid transporter
MEINLIVIHSIGVLLLLLNLIILKWSYLPTINLIIFIILFCINIVCLIFIIFIRIWDSKNTLKTTNKNKGIIFSNICLALLIFCIIGCLIEDYALNYGIRKANYPCMDKVKEDNHYYPNPYYYKKSPKSNSSEELRKLKKEYTTSECESLGKDYYEYNIPLGQIALSYFTISYSEVLSIIEFVLWYFLKKRITFGLDRPGPVVTSVNQFGNQYRRDVVVVQPGDVVYMGGQQIAGPYVYNSGPYQQQPYMSNQVAPNQYNEQIPNSNENQLRGNAQ